MACSRFSGVFVLCATLAAADLTPEQRRLNVESFDFAWKTIADAMWEPMPAGLDWDKVREELRPKVEAAKSMNEARAAMRDMISRLKLTHFNIVPSEVYDRLGHASFEGKGNAASPGFDLRLIGGHPVVVWIEKDSPAYAAGVRDGWRVVKIGETDAADLIARGMKALPDSTTRELLLTRAVEARFNGSPGDKIATEFLDGKDVRVRVDVELKPPRGQPSRLGYMTTQFVWFENRRLPDAGYIRFNMFMDPGRISPLFGDAVQSCLECKGLIIDLRGNPGGIGGMSMGMAGWLVGEKNLQLGVMKTKKDQVKFAIIPRAETFSGPVAILVDAHTGSTSEIFAGGLKDIGRAKIFGTRTAGAALPSVFKKLPNGDGFQYAIANYISTGGKPLEGTGVIPDDEISPTREDLLAGRDPVLDAALEWIRKEGNRR